MFLTPLTSDSQVIQLVECDVDVSPHSLRIVGYVWNSGDIDRIEENLQEGIEDTVSVDLFVDWCGPTGCCQQFDITISLENIFPFHLCVNTYIDTLSASSSCEQSNNEISLFQSQCLSADQILSDEGYLDKSRVNVYPNPTSERLNIDLSSFQKIPSSYVIRDLSGRTLSEGRLREEVERIDVSWLPVGLLILELHTDNGILRQRFVKML
jgi:hypothetical protein